ncbi:MAG TPA: hypothetical protein VN922_14480 [Bacteroidia bacterium]|nr:hypothetical protein [Bacteroidia bacterium]
MEKPEILTAKFKLVTVTKHEGAEEPKLQPVYGDSEENKQWSAFTPGGDLRLYISNPQCFDFFDHDHEYYMELKKVPKKK